MDAEQLEKMTQLVKAIGDLRNLAVLGIICLSLMAFAAFIYFLWNKAKQTEADRAAEERLQAVKTKRAAAYAAALNNVAAAQTLTASEIKTALAQFAAELQQHRMSEAATSQLAVDVMVRLTGAIGLSQRTIEELASQIQPRLTAKDSIRYIQRVFLAEISQAISKILQEVIIKNGYEGDSSFISAETQSAIGEKLRWFQTDLSSYKPLTVRVSDFFELDRTDPSIERFVLCDVLWAIAERLLSEGVHDAPGDHHRKLLVRADRVPLLVQNAIRDYFSRIAAEYTADDDRRELPTGLRWASDLP